MNITLVRFTGNPTIGMETVPRSYLQAESDSCHVDGYPVTLKYFDGTFLEVVINKTSKPYSQLIPWAQCAAVFFDDGEEYAAPQ